MKYTESLCSNNHPDITGDERAIFVRLLANLEEHIVYVYQGKVLEKVCESTFWGATAYLVNWKWDPIIFQHIASGLSNPDPNFVDFIVDYATRVGLYEYEDTEQSRKEFQEALNGMCSFTREANTKKYAFQAELAFKAWVIAHNRGRMKENAIVRN